MLAGWLIRRIDKGDRTRFGQAASIVGIGCNLCLVVAKGIVGISTGSISVVADAVNNLMDALSSVVSLAGFSLAQKPADSGHPYGHGRFEYLAGLGVAVLVVVAGVNLMRDSIQTILASHPVSYSATMMVVLGCSVLMKLWLAWFDRHAANHIGSTTLHAAAQDSLNDAIATGTVLAGALASWTLGLSLDGFLGLGVGLFVTISGVGLLRDTADPLLGATPDPALVERIRKRILSYPGVLGTHDLMVHDYGPGHRFASAHVEMAAEEDPLKTHEIIDRIERDLRATEDLATIIHYDPIVTSASPEQDLRQLVQDAAQRVDERLSIHDLFVTQERGHLNLSFDCVRPQGLELTDAELAQAIERQIHTSQPSSRCHITFDTGYMSAQQ